MDQVGILTKQTSDAYDWTNRLINSIPYKKWDQTPDVIESNISWQVGHLIMSFYYHSIMVITGHQMEILQQIPMKEYDKLFTLAAPFNVIGKTDPALLQKQLLLLQEKSLNTIRSLSPADLESPLVPGPIPHPIAKTRFEAIDWNIKHTMWHCGQIGMIKRVIDERFDFGLKRDL
ncbi:MAG TPA: DinB family protein [Puia sp.]|nr:DinB family protein [Puia sp.]